MKFLLLVPIRIYWKLFPVHRRRPCLFKESCSVHISRITQAKGLIAGLNALRDRHRTCRPGYKVYRTAENGFQLELCTGAVIQENAISERLLPPYSYSYQDSGA
ncbi:MAG: membrane protein insertion efficiency factor YidD [Flavobacteriales bacterium]|nr:membrane protein insertion efficiency factor YidD [Flavobacteriales bacterium]